MSLRAGVRAGETHNAVPSSFAGRRLCAARSVRPRMAADQAADLDEVVVTATRTAVTVDQSLAAVEVIDREQIERSQAHSLPELLRGRAGINLSNQGGAGKLTTLFLRGTESDHVLVLVDGVRIGSSTSGLAAFQDLPLATDRAHRDRARPALEPVRLGSDRRRDPDLHPPRHAAATTPRFALTAGSHGLRAGQRRHRRRRRRVGWYGIDAAYQRTDGINACDVATPTRCSGGCFISTPQPDRDGYRNRSLSLRGGINAGDALTFEGHALRAEGHNDFDGDYVRQLRRGAAGGRRQRANGRRRTHSSCSSPPAATSMRPTSSSATRSMGYFSTDRDSATLQGDLALGAGPAADARPGLVARPRRQRHARTTKPRAATAPASCNTRATLRRARPAGGAAPRRQRPVRRPHHRQRRVGHGASPTAGA